MGCRPVRVCVEGVSTFAQTLEGERFVTRESDSVPPRWMENVRLGDGRSGLRAMAGMRVSIEKSDGTVIGEELVPLESLCERMKEEGVVRYVANIRLKEQKRCVGAVAEMKGRCCRSR